MRVLPGLSGDQSDRIAPAAGRRLAALSIELPLGMFEGLLQVHYVDDQGDYMKPEMPKQRLVIEYVFDPEGRGETPRPALPPFSALNVLVQSADFGIAAVESSSFTLQSLVEFPAGGSMDVFLTTVAGHPTE